MWTSQLVNREDLFDPKRTNKKGKRTERGAYNISLYHEEYGSQDAETIELLLVHQRRGLLRLAEEMNEPLLAHQHPTDSVRGSVQT